MRNTRFSSENTSNILKLVYVLVKKKDQSLCFKKLFHKILKGLFISSKKRQQLNEKLLRKR